MDSIKYLSVNEIAEEYKIDKSYIMSLCKKNIIQYEDYKPANIFIPVKEIEKILDYYKNVQLGNLKKYPIGISDYVELREKGYYYVDKTLLIKDIIQADDKVDLFTRPRRFGKTLTMTMLKAFFEKTNNDTSKYFKDTKIWKAGERFTSEQGKYNVIYLSFKDIKSKNWVEAYDAIQSLIQDEYIRLRPAIVKSENVDPEYKEYLAKITSKSGNYNDFKSSLKNLSKMLYDATNIKTIIIIDEYDTPIQSAYLNRYYNEAIDFFRSLLSQALKDNQYLEKGFVSGILQVAKESIFSGLNNLEVYSLFESQKSEYFGFTKEEVQDMLKYYYRENCTKEVLEWYDGYKFGSREIINPWSVLNYLKNDCTTNEYWSNTSSNDLIKDMVPVLSKTDFDNLCSLMNGKTIDTRLNKNITYLSLNDNPINIYSYLLAAGYLTIDNQRDGNYAVRVPNKEIGNVYKEEVIEQSEYAIGGNIIKEMAAALEKNDAALLKKTITNYMKSTVSYHDTTAELFYQGFVIGLSIVEHGKYWIKSNRESGMGRFDVSMEPINKVNNGIILELKHAKKVTNKEELKKLSNEAIAQSEEKDYCCELQERGVKKINVIGLAFCGKEVEIASKTIDTQINQIGLERNQLNPKYKKDEKEESIKNVEHEKDFFKSDNHLNFLLRIYGLIKNDKELLKSNTQLKETISFCNEKTLIEYDFPRYELIRTINEIGMENILKNESKEWDAFAKDFKNYEEQRYADVTKSSEEISLDDFEKEQRKSMEEDEREGPEM